MSNISKIIIILMYNRPKPISSINALPKNKQILAFRDKLKKADEQNDIVEECYTTASSKVQAYMIVVLCFGDSSVEDNIKEIIKTKKPQSYERKLQNFSKIMNNFSKSKNSNAVKTLYANIKEFGSNYMQLKENIISNISQEEAEHLFNQCCQKSIYLSGTRIRQFHNENIDRQKHRQFQKTQQQYQKGSVYLILDYKSSFVNIATFRTKNYRQTQLGITQNNSSQQKSLKSHSSQSLQIYYPKQKQLDKYTKLDDQSSNNWWCCCQLI